MSNRRRADNRRALDLARREERARRQVAREQGPVGPVTALEMVQEQRLYSGPLPEPSDLREYESILAGLANRIVDMAERQVAMAERQQEHRLARETEALAGLNRRADRGLHYGFVVALVWFAGAVSLVATGHDAAGSVLGSLDLVALVGVFVYGRRDQRRQEERRTE